MSEEAVEINVDGLILRGNIFTPDKHSKKLAVFFLHGWTGRPNKDAAKFLAENGFSSMTFSLGGHNDSQGDINTLSREDFMHHVLAAHDFFASKLADSTQIGAAGSSFGSYLAAVLSGLRELACLSLRVPANYSDEGWSEPQFPQAASFENPEILKWRDNPLSFDATKSLQATHDFNGPIQIIEAEDDDIVPHQTIQNYIDAVQDKAKLEHHLMHGWPHSLGDDPERNRRYQEMLLNWLERI